MENKNKLRNTLKLLKNVIKERGIKNDDDDEP